MAKIILYILIVAAALPAVVYMFKHYGKISMEFGLIALAFSGFFLFGAVKLWPDEKYLMAMLAGLFCALISAMVYFYERSNIKGKRKAKTRRKVALEQYEELMEQYGKLRSESSRDMTAEEKAKAARGIKIMNIIGITLAIASLAGAIAVKISTDNSVFYVLIVTFIIVLGGTLLYAYIIKKQLADNTIYMLKGVVTNKYIEEFSNYTTNYNIVVSKSDQITISKKMYKTLRFGDIISIKSQSDSYNQYPKLAVIGSIMADDNPPALVQE